MTFNLLAALCLLCPPAFAQDNVVTISNLTQLAEVAACNNQTVRMLPGVYRMADYLTESVLEQNRARMDRSLPRPPVPMMLLRGDNNRFDLRDVVVEIDTTLYAKLPGKSYIRCIIIAGNGNHFDGQTLRSTDPQKGSNGNIISVAGASNTLENVTLNVGGSFPYGYGDLFGNGGPNLLPLQKQTGGGIK